MSGLQRHCAPRLNYGWSKPGRKFEVRDARDHETASIRTNPEDDGYVSSSIQAARRVDAALVFCYKKLVRVTGHPFKGE
jgi:hypothetical protein